MKKRLTRNESKRKRRSKRARRQKLGKATAAYYGSLSGEALKHEQRLESAIGHAASQVKFDKD